MENINNKCDCGCECCCKKNDDNTKRIISSIDYPDFFWSSTPIIPFYINKQKEL